MEEEAGEEVGDSSGPASLSSDGSGATDSSSPSRRRLIHSPAGHTALLPCSANPCHAIGACTLLPGGSRPPAAAQTPQRAMHPPGGRSSWLTAPPQAPLGLPQLRPGPQGGAHSRGRASRQPPALAGRCIGGGRSRGRAAEDQGARGERHTAAHHPATSQAAPHRLIGAQLTGDATAGAGVACAKRAVRAPFRPHLLPPPPAVHAGKSGARSDEVAQQACCGGCRRVVPRTQCCRSRAGSAWNAAPRSGARPTPCVGPCARSLIHSPLGPRQH